uniref:LEAF RUST 10 DISEASE-RESISTANCE LOCUS RECEPTOR-LIKE PROTEIN KINASE-like 1.2 n=1 Tax=Erigeron canadensis TaxID=72917 RepID=UPI001CB9A433|nr:LEAF RUST 10 DISEASE-RESISTANCE LOCUS RECEPTOR-LIKE PROTEIN KINASE-like 1.2 [Erigeron canadensis]
MAVLETIDTKYPGCPSYKCSGTIIGYPFWVIPNQTNNGQFCGYHGLGINCSDLEGTDRPTIYLKNDLYHVRNITNTSIILSYNHFPVNNTIPLVDQCLKVNRTIELENLPFNFSNNNLNLSFHFNCSRPPPPDYATPIPCMNSVSNRSYVNVIHDNYERFDDWDCNEIVTTVFDYATLWKTTLSWRDYASALIYGFELNGQRPDDEDCDKCEESDGRCGFRHANNTRQFLCFCSDGTITTNNHCKKGDKVDWKRKLAIALGSVGFGIILMCVVFYFLKRRDMKKRNYGSSYISRKISSYASSITDPEKSETYHGVQLFKYRELEKATNYFDSANELGDGGFGTVYQGKLKDGRVVAVKRLYENNYKRVEQFMNEVGILAHLRHQNLVSLYGCTTHHSRELLLVYEYIPNGTVADHLHGEKSKPGSLTWNTRMSISIETASALVYLHASDVIHRDVKTNNILLDNSFTVKVADFGLSRLFPNNVTHVSTAPQGTPGYVDPEYHECYQLTSKSDVYSFGVVLIELISSMPAVDITRHRHEINLSNMALTKIRNDALHELVDPNLGFESDYDVRKMITAVAELAFLCLQNDRDSRPTMGQVLKTLLEIQNAGHNKVKKDVFEGICEDTVLLNDNSQTLSPDSVAIGWSTSTMSSSNG